MKEQQRQVYRSARGREVDMLKLINQNELTIAVGNAKVNARGDKIGPKGEIIQRREDIQKEISTPIVPDRSIKPAPAKVEAPVLEKIVTVKDVSDMDPEGNE
jgi:hypothetical protein